MPRLSLVIFITKRLQVFFHSFIFCSSINLHFERVLGYCMSVLFRDHADRLIRIDQPPEFNMEGQEEEGQIRLQLQVPSEAIGKVYSGIPKSSPSCIILLADTHTFVIKPNMLPSLPRFCGMKSESPCIHIKEFEEMV